MTLLRKNKKYSKGIWFFILSTIITCVLHVTSFPGILHVSNNNVYYISEAKSIYENAYILAKINKKKHIFLVKHTFGDKYCKNYFNEETQKVERMNIDNQCLRIPLDYLMIENENSTNPILIHKKYIIRKMYYLGSIWQLYNKILKNEYTK